MGGISTLVRSKKWKSFMAYLYGWGASIVILGALFKIMHFKGAGPMLIAGMGTEAIIFFFSAFEPPHVEPDWSLVYPELSGMYQGYSDELDGLEGGNKSATEELDNMLEEAKIGPELIESLGLGLTKMSENASKLGDISDAAVFTGEYMTNIKSATESAGKFAETISNDAAASGDYVEKMNRVASSATQLSDAYTETAKSISRDMEATDDYVNGIKAATVNAVLLADKYKSTAESLANATAAIDFSDVDGTGFANELKKVSSNLTALNSMYEVQLQSSKAHVDISAEMQDGMKQFIESLSNSVDSTSNYKDGASQLAANMAALNNVYGNMLNAMTIQK